jgi:hypothetical protein
MHPGPPFGDTEFRFAGRTCFTGGHFSQLSTEHLLASMLLCEIHTGHRYRSVHGRLDKNGDNLSQEGTSVHVLLTLGGGIMAVAHPSAALCIAFSKCSRNSSKSLILHCSQVPQHEVPLVGVTASLKRGREDDESSGPPCCWLISRARLFMAPANYYSI